LPKNIKINLQKPNKQYTQNKFYKPDRRKYKSFQMKQQVKLNTFNIHKPKKFQYKKVRINSMDNKKASKKKM